MKTFLLLMLSLANFVLYAFTGQSDHLIIACFLALSLQISEVRS